MKRFIPSIIAVGLGSLGVIISLIKDPMQFWAWIALAWIVIYAMQTHGIYLDEKMRKTRKELEAMIQGGLK